MNSILITGWVAWFIVNTFQKKLLIYLEMVGKQEIYWKSKIYVELLKMLGFRKKKLKVNLLILVENIKTYYG